MMEGGVDVVVMKKEWEDREPCGRRRQRQPRGIPTLASLLGGEKVTASAREDHVGVGG